MADVPLGAFLSGGVDSSAVVAMMARQSSVPSTPARSPSTTAISTNPATRAQVAERFTPIISRGSRRWTISICSTAWSTFYDEPFADSSALPTYLVCALARERVTVALSGDGGDEIFAGYRRYFWHQNEQSVRSLLPDRLRAPLFGTLGRSIPSSTGRRGRCAPRRRCRTWRGARRRPTSTRSARCPRACASGSSRRRSGASSAGYRPIDVLRGHMERAGTDDSLSQIQYADMKTYLPGDILTKVDRASMATSLEVRVPLLDHELVQWLAGIPSALKLRGREGKYLFKKALEPHLPREILYRPKMGFAVPLKAWFRGPLRERVRRIVTSGSLVETGLFDVPYLRTLVDQHQSGVSDHSSAIWSLMMFESFLRNTHGQPLRLPDVPPRERVRAAVG